MSHSRTSPTPPRTTIHSAKWALIAAGMASGWASAQSTEPDAAQVAPSPKDRYLIRLSAVKAENGATPSEQPGADAAVATAKRAGRLILFFTPDTPRWANIEPSSGPFFEKLQPIASIAVTDLPDDGSYVFEPERAVVFGGPLEHLQGAWRVQAVLDSDVSARGHLGPGNLVSRTQSIELASDRADEITIDLTGVIQPDELPSSDAVTFITRKSALLSAHFGRAVSMRAGVVLPYGYDDLTFERRMWPTIYVIGGFGANHLAAIEAASALQSPQARGAVPQAVWVFLDADGPWGHSGFCDSDANGPMGKALVSEFIPFLEERFRLITTTPARVVTGHSSGGWSALHLAITYPQTFGACFASAPDPVDFSAFQCTDLLRDLNLFVSRDGTETPSHRGVLGPTDERIFMTVRDEIASEHAIDPDGRSGEQWDAWNAQWSPWDAARNAPRRLCDPMTGAIDPVTVEAWLKHDIARIFESDPTTYGPLFDERIRVLCGSRDSFYLNNAVTRLKAKIGRWRAGTSNGTTSRPQPTGFIEVIDGLTHDSLYPVAQIRFHQGMLEHLRAHNLAEADPHTRGSLDARRDETGKNAGDSRSPNRDSAPTPQPR